MTFQKAILPGSVEIAGSFYNIKDDFRHALIFLARVKENAPLHELDFMYEGDPPEDRAAGARAIYEWAHPKPALPRGTAGGAGDPIVDYEADAGLIFAGFWQCYGIDLFDPDLRLHWHKFLALLAGLQGTRLNDIMRIRAWKPGKKDTPEYRREMSRLKEMWRIEEPLSAEDEEAIARFDAAVEASKARGDG